MLRFAGDRLRWKIMVFEPSVKLQRSVMRVVSRMMAEKKEKTPEAVRQFPSKDVGCCCTVDEVDVDGVEGGC